MIALVGKLDGPAPTGEVAPIAQTKPLGPLPSIEDVTNKVKPVESLTNPVCATGNHVNEGLNTLHCTE